MYGGSGHTREMVFIKKDNLAKTIEIKTGIQDDTYIEVTKGLKDAETVITGPYNVISKELKDGDKIKALDKAKQKNSTKNEKDDEKSAN